VVMVSQLGPAIDVRTTFRDERDLLFQLLENSTNRNGLRPQYALAGLCATLPRTCYTMIFAASVAAATTSKAQFPVPGNHCPPF